MSSPCLGDPGRGVTSPSVLRIRLFLLLLFSGALAGLAVTTMILAAPASADEPIFASPPPGERLFNAPNSVQLSFTGLVRASSTLEVRGPDGSADLGRERRAGVTLTQRLKPELPAGTYTVAWDVELQNGRVSTGSYLFVVTAGSDEKRQPSKTRTWTTPTSTDPEPTDTHRDKAEPSPRWTPSTVAEQTTRTEALVISSDSPTSSGTGKGNTAIGLLSLFAAVGIIGTLVYGWRSGWWTREPAPVTPSTRRGPAETSELPPITPDGG
jgi:methionine-rich copper-binding protein CopC